ncbi:MAG: B12-binding domain-containing radical SAM protein, partial [Bacteroidales bacterium]|nr:B12-binding domain-containing radical SAM protein [Bacteroidales bacterium]
MRILWLDINSSYSHSSLAIPALHAQLLPHDESKHKWQILSGTINRDQSFYLSQISEFRPDYILSTSWLFNHIFLLTILNRAKALLPDLRIVLGGPEYLGENREYLIKNRFITA